jgi:hypothetical protein
VKLGSILLNHERKWWVLVSYAHEILLIVAQMVTICPVKAHLNLLTKVVTTTSPSCAFNILNVPLNSPPVCLIYFSHDPTGITLNIPPDMCSAEIVVHITILLAF